MPGVAKESLYVIETYSSFNPDRPRAVCGGGKQYDDDNKNEESVLLNN